jgi:hypothetical protein
MLKALRAQKFNKKTATTIGDDAMEPIIREMVGRFYAEKRLVYDKAAHVGFSTHGAGAIFIGPMNPFIDEDTISTPEYVKMSDHLAEAIPDLRNNIAENNFKTHWVAVFSVYSSSDKSTSAIKVVRFPYRHETTKKNDEPPTFEIPMGSENAEPIDLQKFKQELLAKQHQIEHKEKEHDEIMSAHLEHLVDTLYMSDEDATKKRRGDLDDLIDLVNTHIVTESEAAEYGKRNTYDKRSAKATNTRCTSQGAKHDIQRLLKNTQITDTDENICDEISGQDAGKKAGVWRNEPFVTNIGLPNNEPFVTNIGLPNWRGLKEFKNKPLLARKDTKQCSACTRIGEDLDMKQCSGCKRVYYCGKECQANDWARHKKYCKK